MAALPDVYCTLVLSDSYLPGAAVLAHSLRDSGTSKQLAVLVTVDTLLYDTLVELRKLYDHVIPVHSIANPSLENLARLDRLDLRLAFTKINLWRQEQFRKIVYIDSDVVALRAPDELFDLDAPFAAAPDIGWPDCFNSGVMLLQPSEGEFWALQTLAASGTSFDGADQGLLNEYYANRPWKRLSFTYNCTPSSGYQYEPAYRHYRSSISMAHFIGKDKPWTLGRKALEASGSGVYKELLGKWWSVYDRHYRRSQTSALGAVQPSHHVQRFVMDERPQSAVAWAASSGLALPPPSQLPQQHAQALAPHHEHAQPPAPAEASHVTTDQPFTEATDQAVEMHPQAPFEAPSMEWDATRSAPPQESKPEAASFPTSHYEMSNDPGLFKPPTAYPEPPKNMWYTVPDEKPSILEQPKPIFPWESKQAPRKPTRVFVAPPPVQPQDRPSTPPQQTASSSSSSSYRQDSIFDYTRGQPPSREFTMGANAWDADPSIDAYVRAMKEAQARRSRASGHRAAPSLDAFDSPGIALRNKRDHPSLRLTDFPTADDRPSLPVTPAPVHRSVFWANERDEHGDLPAADGVPHQSDWNPLEKLEQLRRSSLIATQELPKAAPTETPLREELASAAPMPVNAGAAVSPSGREPVEEAAQFSESAQARTALLEPAFGSGQGVAAAGEIEDVDPKSVLHSSAD